ncbi:hypothetical protein KGM_204425 [Danaus plexippus plexippus]|uniref:Uncharacterized protein n=1 Tax=Danaus plexippus plexippus TaxID=278856 RepID=A0A212ES63_DANPL|nr:hypothetical protein KGM_204425 [Danaus plexippus plexippus]
MVARVHCDFATILQRYDCDQSYSVHTCNECQVSRYSLHYHMYQTIITGFDS